MRKTHSLNLFKTMICYVYYTMVNGKYKVKKGIFLYF